MPSIFDKINSVDTPVEKTEPAAPKRVEKPSTGEPNISGADKTAKPMSLSEALAKMKPDDNAETSNNTSLEETLNDSIPDFTEEKPRTTSAPDPNKIDLNSINNMTAPGAINPPAEDNKEESTTINRNIPGDPVVAEIGNPPPASATPEEVTQYYLDKLSAAVKHNTAGKETLKELHFQLAENPDTKDLLLPEHLGMITSLMDKLTGSAHNRMTTKKAETVKRRSKKAELEAEVAADLDLGELNISL